MGCDQVVSGLNLFHLNNTGLLISVASSKADPQGTLCGKPSNHTTVQSTL